MSTLLGPLAIVSLVLAVGGVAKLRDPAPTSAMLASFGLPRSDVLSRGLGLYEVSLGVATVVVGGRVLAGLLALTYAALTVVSFQLWRAGDASVSCGCFGRRSARPSAILVAVDLTATLIATVAAGFAVAGLADALPTLDHGGVLEVAFIGLGTALLVSILTVLPDTLDAARRGPGTPAVPLFEVERST